MSGETKSSVSGWTIDTLAVHHTALREADLRFQEERDRRYAEVATEREKALKIKETADLAALGLAREIQTYKDEKANQLREQINTERGSYATGSDLRSAIEKVDAVMKPIADFVASQQGRSSGFNAGWVVLLGVVGLGSTILAGGVALYSLNRGPAASPPQQVIYIPTTPSAVTPTTKGTP